MKIYSHEEEKTRTNKINCSNTKRKTNRKERKKVISSVSPFYCVRCSSMQNRVHHRKNPLSVNEGGNCQFYKLTIYQLELAET